MTTTVAEGSAAPPVRRVELDVSGMTCAACAARVETRLNKLDGVRASVNYATRVATVDAPATVASAQLCDVVRTPTTPRPARCCCVWRWRRCCSCRSRICR